MARVLVLLALVLLAPTVFAQGRTLAPRDEGAADPTFITFRGRLIEALAARDTAAVLSAFSPEARLSFGDTRPGPAGVREMWFRSGRTAEFLATLTRVVAMGSTRDSTGLVSAPYVFGGWPGGVDPFQHGALVGENVRIRQAPSTSAEVVATLSYAVLPVTDWGPGSARDGWARVTLGAGDAQQAGYVNTRFLWSPVDYRAGFERLGGRWQLVFFLAGD